MADYFAMLEKEFRGERYSKTEHRRRLLQLLHNRSETAIERKHQNISAVLVEDRFPYINGYKPLSNYQALLSDSVLAHIEDDGALSALALSYVEAPAQPVAVRDLLTRMESPPNLLELARIALSDHARARRARKVDYLALEARNRALGEEGERFVVSYERAVLASYGLGTLAKRVEHVSSTRGDGLGFDVLSFSRDGEEKFIEVKTTRMGSATPFYVSSNEVEFSVEQMTRYSLYRVYAYGSDPRLFALAGSLSMSCDLQTSQYRALPRVQSVRE